MGVQWKYLWPVLVLAAALTLGLGAALRFLRPASLGERIGVAEGASLRQVVVERSDGGGHGSHESSEPALLAELSSLLAGTLWAYRPVSLAEAADARTGLESKVAVVVRLDELDGNGTFHEYQAYDPALLEQMELLVDTAQLRLVRRSSTAPLDGMCMVLIIGEDNIICSFDYNLDTNAIYIGDRIYALRSTQSEPLSELVSAVCGEV